jgi:nucleoside-diphosphate-sugar epimerase
MRIFVTGATGFVGSAITQELLDAGHQVTGLARSDAAAQKLAAQGVVVVRGNLEDLQGLQQAAADADGVIHTAFNHDFSKFQANCEQDRRVIQALGEALAGSARPLVVTSGIGILPPDQPATENTRPGADSASVPRIASEQAAYALAARGVNVSIVRLPPSVHGSGDHGFVPLLIGIARQQGAAAYIGDGTNQWSAVHRLDAALAYRLIIEKAKPDSIWHVVGEEAITFRSIAETIGKRLKLPVIRVENAAAAAHFGWFAHFAARQMSATSARTRQELGWQPAQAGLIADLGTPDYFER